MPISIESLITRLVESVGAAHRLLFFHNSRIYFIMAFISEVNFLGTGAGEFVEIALGPGDDPADFVVSVYRDTGSLHTGAGISGGEVNLSTLTGNPDPDNAAYTIYVIPVGIRDNTSSSNEGSGIALTDTSAGGGVVDFYSSGAIAPIPQRQARPMGPLRPQFWIILCSDREKATTGIFMGMQQPAQLPVATRCCASRQKAKS